jgi:ribosomal protein S8
MNKIENSAYKEYVTDLLQQGISTREIADMLKEKGFEVSHSVVNEFRKKNNIETEVQEQEQYLESNNDCEVITNTENLSKKDLLTKIYENQLLIVYHKQNSYLNGKSKKFPESEFRALKVIDDLMTTNEQEKIE